MAETKISQFELDLKKRFSLARNAATIALANDLPITERAGIAYPPALTVREMTTQFYVNQSPTMTPEEEKALSGQLSERLTTWAEEGFFELHPVAGSTAEDRVAYRITDAGAAIAIEALSDHSQGLNLLAQQAQTRLGLH